MVGYAAVMTPTASRLWSRRRAALPAAGHLRRRRGVDRRVEQTMSAALRQRCLIHRARNVLAKVPKNAQVEVKADYWAIFDVPEGVEPGLDAVAHVQKKIDEFTRRWRDSYPDAVRCLLTDREQLTHYLRVPREHWSRVRHSNFIEAHLRRDPPPGQGHRPAPR
jgi:transposase-like protein